MYKKLRKKRRNNYRSFIFYNKNKKNNLIKKKIKYSFCHGNKNEKEFQLDMKLELYYRESQKRLENLNENISVLRKREVTLLILKEQLEYDVNETNMAVRKLKIDEEKLAQLTIQEGQLLKEHGWITKKQKEQIEWFKKENKKLNQFVNEEELLHIQSWKSIKCSKKKLYNLIKLPIFLRPCDTILKQIDRWENIWIFEEDVDIIKYPSYINVIKRPMSFSRCRENLYNNKYKSILHFSKDVNQIWENAKKFNPPGNKVHVLADIYNKQFNKLLEKILSKKNQLESHMVKKSVSLKLDTMLMKKQNTENVFLINDELNELSRRLNNLPPKEFEKVIKLVKKYKCLEIGNLNLKKTTHLQVLPTYILRQLQKIVRKNINNQ